MSAAAQSWWSQAAAAALDLVVPQQCAGCGTPGLAWCPQCVHACAGRPLRVPGPVPCRAACEHHGPAGRAVVAFKDDGVRRLGQPLGSLLAHAAADALADAGAPRGMPVWVVPVPSRRSAVRSRGADHTAVLAGLAALRSARAGVPANRCVGLQHVRASRDQVGLTREQRVANVAGSLRGLALPPGVIVVVDDVTTTGATVAEAVRALAVTGRAVSCAAAVTWSPGPRHRASESRSD
jgi:predicted amidophosphoribosyltransferase